MGKFQIEWTREEWYRVTIEADNEEQAREKFWEGEYENEKKFGAEIQDGVEVKEVK